MKRSIARGGAAFASALLLSTWLPAPTLGSAANPQAHSYPDSPGLPAPTYVAGDTWVFNRTHENGKAFSQERVMLRVERVGADDMLLGIKPDGSPADFEDHRVGLDWSESRVVDGKPMITERVFSFPLKVGETWQEDYVDPRRQGMQTFAHIQKTYKVVGWEDVTVPAGTFHALKIEANGLLTATVSIPATAVSAAAGSAGGATSVARVERARSGVLTQPTYRALYYVPEIKTYVKIVYEQYDSENVRVKRDTGELAWFKPGS
jgi:hypothetical protein